MVVKAIDDVESQGGKLEIPTQIQRKTVGGKDDEMLNANNEENTMRIEEKDIGDELIAKLKI